MIDPIGWVGILDRQNLLNATEFNLGVGSHVGITLWCKRYSWVFFGYISVLDSLNMKYLFCSQLILIFPYLTSAWMLFFRTVANAFPTSYHIKSVCSCWVLKPSNNTCLLNLVPSASFLIESDSWRRKLINCSALEKKPWEQGWYPQRPW